MRVKAKMMIPRPELDEDGDIIDPREELMKQLIDYRRFRDAADMLDKMADISEANSIPRQFEQEIPNVDDQDLGILLECDTLRSCKSF